MKGEGGSDYFYFQTDVGIEDKQGVGKFPQHCFSLKLIFPWLKIFFENPGNEPSGKTVNG